MGDGFSDSQPHYEDVRRAEEEARPRVVNVRDGVQRARRTLYVGRPTRWGNPFTLKTESDRGHILGLYKRWLDGDPGAIAMARKARKDPRLLPPTRHEIRASLRGFDLACWCAPRQCHADVLLEIANS